MTEPTSSPTQQGTSQLIPATSITVGLGWDAKNSTWHRFWAKLRRKSPHFDLDLACFLMNADGKVGHVGNAQLLGGDVVFFNHRKHPSGTVIHSGDHRTGDAHGEDEQIGVALHQLPNRYHQVVFVVSVFEGEKRRQDLADFHQAFLRVTDSRGTELGHIPLSGPDFKGTRTLLCLRLQRAPEGHWTAAWPLQRFEYDTFTQLLRSFV